jgi:2-polyprenyl-3-methyl-5-hydroxy-6-metoxy-1,4-benzoquinol methylase
MIDSMKKQLKSAADQIGATDEVARLVHKLSERAAGDSNNARLNNEIQLIKRFIGLWSDEHLRAQHPRAMKIFQEMQKYKYNLTDGESRLQELVDFFGYEKGSKAPYCRVYGGESTALREQLKVTPTEYCLLHMVALINRMSPQRDDLFYVFDFALERLDEAFPDRSKVGIVDLGCGHGQCGLAFAMAGYHVYFIDVQKDYLDWVEFSCKSRGITNYTIIGNYEGKSAFERTSFKHPIVGVIEWSCFEHFYDPVAAITWVKDILEPSGVFITTTSIIEWTEQKRLEYVVDCGEETTKKLMSKEFSSVSRDFFTIHDFTTSHADVLVKK